MKYTKKNITKVRIDKYVDKYSELHKIFKKIKEYESRGRSENI